MLLFFFILFFGIIIFFISYQALSLSKPYLCFLSVRPSIDFYDLCVRFVPKYTVFICVDDNDYIIPWKDERIHIIRFSNKVCEDAGYHSTVLYFQKKACARDKALYYFSEIMSLPKHQQVWFVEEDVFLPSLHTLTRLDRKYKHTDLLCRDLIPKSTALEWKFWNHCPFEEQHCIRTMICIIRLSGGALSSIREFVKRNHHLVLDEILFPSLATVDQWRIKCPVEFQYIRYRDTENNFPKLPTDVNKKFAYHPMKNILHQKQLCGIPLLTSEVE